MTRKQAEERTRLEDAVSWGMFEGEGPAPERMREAGTSVPARAGEDLRERFCRIAAQLDERTRNDLHDSVVAIACHDDVDPTGTRLFAIMRAPEPPEELEDGRPRPPDLNHP